MFAAAVASSVSSPRITPAQELQALVQYLQGELGNIAQQATVSASPKEDPAYFQKVSKHVQELADNLSQDARTHRMSLGRVRLLKSDLESAAQALSHRAIVTSKVAEDMAFYQAALAKSAEARLI